MDNLHKHVYTHVYENVNGVTLHVVQAGPEDGPLLIFLQRLVFVYGFLINVDIT